MIRTLVVAAVVALLSQTPSQQGAVRDLIWIDAVAETSNGTPVRDLKADDVEVWVSGYRVPVAEIDRVLPEDDDRGGRIIVLLLDDVTVSPQLAPRVREAAKRFVNRMLPGDQMAIVSLNGSRMELTSDPKPLLRAVDDFHQKVAGVMRLEDLGQHVLVSIASLARQMQEPDGRRKAIVAIGARWLFDTPLPPPGATRDLRAEWFEAMRATALANASLYVIDPMGLSVAPADVGGGSFARETGGHAFINTNDVRGAVERIWRETGTYYLIGIEDPPIQRTAEVREIDVRSKRKGVTVRARRGIPGKIGSQAPAFPPRSPLSVSDAERLHGIDAHRATRGDQARR